MSGNTTPVQTEGWAAVTAPVIPTEDNTTETTHVVSGDQEKFTQSSLNVETHGDVTTLQKDSVEKTTKHDASGVETFNKETNKKITATFPATPITPVTINKMEKQAEFAAGSEPPSPPEQSLFAKVMAKIKAPFVYAGQKISDGYRAAQNAYFNFLERHPRLKSIHDTISRNIGKIALAVAAIVGTIFLFKSSPKAAAAAQSAVNGVTDAAAKARDGLYTAGAKASEGISSAATTVGNSVKGAGESIRNMLFSGKPGTPPAPGASTIPAPLAVESTFTQTTRVTPGLG